MVSRGVAAGCVGLALTWAMSGAIGCDSDLSAPSAFEDGTDSSSDALSHVPADDEELRLWLADPQLWERDSDGPALQLGAPGTFDDTHLVAPYVAVDQGEVLLWYSGSTSSVAGRKYHIGLATSGDGLRFTRRSAEPALTLPKELSALTLSVLTDTRGNLVRDAGRIRGWFSASDLRGEFPFTLHHATALDPRGNWSKPSPPLLDAVYAPSVILDNGLYRMWFTEASQSMLLSAPIRYAWSHDGLDWTVEPEPALEIDQEWERLKLVYPRVVKHGDLYLMWYGANWSKFEFRTAIGFAVSRDGVTWYKSPNNPVLMPDPQREWEAFYTTSHSVILQPDGRFRIWYASRPAPPFVHKYFAISTAVWSPPDSVGPIGD